jgi:hypothetical protein
MVLSSKNCRIMKKYCFALLLFIGFTITHSVAQKNYPVNEFDKVIVSPHIQVTFVAGDEESVRIESNSVSSDKLNIEVNNKTLRIYLDSAKEYTRNRKTSHGYEQYKTPVYQGTVVTAVVTYKTLNELSLRGEENHVCKSPLNGGVFKMWIYGESEVTLNEVNLDELVTVFYGESDLFIKAGSIRHQKYTSYGESKVNSYNITGRTSKVTSYGEADFKLNVSDEIKLVAFGETKLHYKGNPVISKKINMGELEIDKVD